MNNDNSEDHFWLLSQYLVLMAFLLPPVTVKVCSLTYLSRWTSTEVKAATDIFISSEEVQVTNDRFFILHSSPCLTDVSYFQHCLKSTAIVPGSSFILLWITENRIQHITALTKTYLATNITESGSSYWSYHSKTSIFKLFKYFHK